MAKFRINYNTVAHGTISWRHEGKDDQYCEAGEAVTLSWQPSAGWGLQEAHYTDGNGNVVPINLTTRTFDMPSSDITISGTFKRFSLPDWTGDGEDGTLAKFGENGEMVPSTYKESDIANMSNAIAVTYSQLVTLRNAGHLVAGRWYRITDYACTSTQAHTSVGNHQYDIIVLALGPSSLCETAFADHHDGDTYFSDCDLQGWVLKYSLDNDDDKFAWADTEHGKGVVWWMRDEWGNECWYDFKNIMFTRWAVDDVVAASGVTLPAGLADSLTESFGFSDTGLHYAIQDADYTEGNITIEVENTEFEDYYTFSFKNADGQIQDASVVAQNLVNDEGINEGVKCNVIAQCKGQSEDDPTFVLNNIVFMTSKDEDDFYYGCYYNTFGQDCNNNTFGQNCSSNTFGQNCYSNTFGQGCYYNTFVQNCYSNTFGYGCYGNTFGQDCNNNTFGQNCSSNTFGQNCYSNTFGQNCYSNTFGQGCNSNTFGQGCNSNTFGYGCSYNTFGQGCNSNTFGQGCNSNTFGQNCYSNTFGQGCNSNTFGENVIFCCFERNNDYINIEDEFDGLQYVHVCSGVKGTNNSPLTFDASDLVDEAEYSQWIARKTDDTLRIWNPADGNPT